MAPQATAKVALVGALSFAALLASLIAESRVLLLLGLGGLVMLAQARVASTSRLEPGRREAAPTKATEDDVVSIAVRVAGPRRGAALVEVRDRVPAAAKLASGSNHAFLVLRRGESRRLAYELVHPTLGVHRVGPVDVRTEDAFGLRANFAELPLNATYVVRPRTVRLRRTPDRSELPQPLIGRHEVSQPGEGFDFFGLRDYMPGDRMRSVNWKASARSPTLVVNQYERESRAEVVLFLDARDVARAGIETETSWVQCARAAASLSQRFLRARDTLRIIVYGTNVSTLGQPGQRPNLEEILDDLARVEPGGDTPFLRAVDENLPSLRPRSPVIVLSPLLGDPTIEDAVTRLLSHRLDVTVVVPKPGAAHDAPGLGEARVERRLAIEAVQSLGARVVELIPGEPATVRLEGVGA